MTARPSPRRPGQQRIVETRATAYWRAVCCDLRTLGARPAALPECDALRLAGYAPREAANVLS